MRGHSAMIEGSLVYRTVPWHVRLKAADLDVPKEDGAVEMKTDIMKSKLNTKDRTDALITLLDNEVQSAAKLRANLAHMKENTDENLINEDLSGDDKTPVREGKEAVDGELRELIQLGIAYAHPGAAGPSVQMYDLVLDALANPNNASKTNIALSRSLLEDVLKRYQALTATMDYFQLNQPTDGSSDFTDILNISGDETVENVIEALKDIDMEMFNPTAVTFNAVLRAIANVNDINPSNEQERDDALSIAFLTLYKIHDSDCVSRNSATFAYMLQVISKLIPESRSRGNIARGLFEKACEDGVVNESVIESLSNAGGGIDFKRWLPSIISLSENNEMPQKWRQNVKRKIHRHGAGLY